MHILPFNEKLNMLVAIRNVACLIPIYKPIKKYWMLMTINQGQVFNEVQDGGTLNQGQVINNILDGGTLNQGKVAITYWMVGH